MNMNFPLRLTEIRRKSGMSQKEAAAGLGVSQALLSHYERGIRECGLNFVVKAAKFYHVTSDYLLGLCEKSYSYIQGGGHLPPADSK